jgi:hypothetical protein
MKTLTVFIGLAMMFTATVCFQSDAGRYARAQTYLKALAEECAAAAALFYDEEAYAEGWMVFNAREGGACISHILENTPPPPDFTPAGPFSYEVEFYDDDRGYARPAVGFAPTSAPSVAVRISVATEDIFRLPFITVESLEREAMYELPPYA